MYMYICMYMYTVRIVPLLSRTRYTVLPPSGNRRDATLHQCRDAQELRGRVPPLTHFPLQLLRT